MSSSSAWLGLNDREIEGYFVWNGGTPLVEYSNWNTGSPKPNGSDFDYVEIEKSTGKWNNVLGNKSIGNICMKHGKDLFVTCLHNLAEYEFVSFINVLFIFCANRVS